MYFKEEGGRQFYYVESFIVLNRLKVRTNIAKEEARPNAGKRERENGEKVARS